SNRVDDRFFSHALVKRLPAENLLDAICQVTGRPERFASAPPGTRAIELPDTTVESPFLDAFGRPPRQVTCECERSSLPSVAQALHLLNAGTINAKLLAPDSELDRLCRTHPRDSELVDELYMRALARRPTSSEAAVISRSLSAARASAGSTSADAARRHVL